MRSRYCAFAKGLGEYLAATGSRDDAKSLSDWARSVTWLGLQVLETEAGSATDSTGRVRFIARYLEVGTLCELAEFSNFSRVDGRWHYDNGDTSFVTRQVERNEPCPCGSGQKFKKCHAA